MKCKQDEKALQESEEQYKAIFDNSLDGVFLTIPDGTILAANPAACQMFGMIEEELIQAGRNGTVDTSDPRLKYVLEARAKTGRFKGELNHRRKDGTIFPSEISSALFKDKDGLVKGVIIIRDITARKQAEDALRRSEEQYRMLFTNMTEGFGLLEVIYNNDGRPYDYRYLEVNPAFERYLGLKREQLLGKTMRETFPNVSPIAIEKYREVALSGQPINFEIFSQIANKYLDIRAFIPEKGKIALILRDVSERKQEEYRINRYNNTLKGINRIFSSVVKAETEEELGNWFLSVAIGITGSQFGFVGEVGADGLLHDIAISDMGWEQCLMYDKIGHRRPPGDFVLHGLYGHVVDSGKGFFTNDPSLHPDSIGLPQGHPPLTSFLGVPLISNGKTIGLIAVANREGGYSYEQQEDLEAITPAVVQTLEKKREEQERARAEEALIRRESEFRTLAENSPDVIARFDRQNRHLYVNPAAAEVYGYSQEEIIGKKHNELGRDPEQIKSWERHHQKVFATGHPEVMEFRYISPQGKEYYFNTQIVPEFINGAVTYVLAISRNITDIKQAEAKLKDTLDNLDKLVKERTAELQTAYDSLKKSEKNLAEAQEMANIGSWEREFSSNEYSWSDEMYRIFGLNPQESKVNYDTFLNYVHPEDRNYVDSAVKKALKGKALDINFRIIRTNGEERIIHAKAEVFFDEKNYSVRIRGTTQDITEHKKAEEKIQNLANVVESSTEAIITKSFEGIITSWNKGAEKVYGYSAEEVLGKYISILEPPTLNGETERLSEMVKQGEKIRQFETLRLRKDGKLINVSLTVFPVFNNQGKITAASIIATDITRRKEAEEKLRESEEKYRNIVEISNEGIYLVDNEAKITYANKMMETSGYTLEEIIGRPIWDFISEESIPVAKRCFEKRRQGIDDSYELKLIRKDGSFVWGLISAKSLFNEEGKFIGYLAMLTDITKRKEAEETLENLETARKKEIHHRIKNNLQVISSLLDLQAEQFRKREDIRDSEVLEAFQESQDRVISMALIHEELYKGGGFETLNFSPYIQELADTLFQTYRLGNEDISLNIDLEENISFDMDTAVPLGIIVNELVSNSLKHAFIGRDEGEVRIKLHRDKSTEFESKDSESTSTSTGFILTISDNGVGVPENLDIENLENLGMQLVTSLVDQLDGELQLKRDNGTEFTVRFKIIEKNE